MTDLSDFLLARIAEDEEAARAAVKPSGFYIGPGPTWRVESDEPRIPAAEGHVVAAENWVITGEQTEDTDSGPWSQPADVPLEIADHIARHDPARVLAECKSKRRIVKHAEVVSGMDQQIEGEWGKRSSVPFEEDEGIRLLRFLALPYADHPDFQPEWKP